MIDTDKYKGHTPGPWKLVEGDPCDDKACWMDIVSEENPVVIQECVGFSDVPESTPDVRLMVDAPLILAELKGWHKVMDYILNESGYPWLQKSDPMDIAFLLNYIDEVIK